MAALFLDTSAVAKRYVTAEAHARKVQGACAPAAQNVLLVARHTSVEVASALARRTREGLLLPQHRERLWRSFIRHWSDQYQVVPASEPVCHAAESLVFKHALRAADAVQIASALLVMQSAPAGPLRFWTADQRQAAAAQAEGLAVELLA